MNRLFTSRCRLLLLLLLPLFVLGTETGLKDFRKGREYIRERQWEQALDTFSEFGLNYSHSIYADDALFWTGFSLEQLNRTEEALHIFQDVVDRYPESLWADDAKVHAIQIVLKSNDLETQTKRSRLRRFAADADSSVRIQAILALGALADPEVIPLLENMAKGEDAVLSKSAIELLESYPVVGSGIPEPIQDGEGSRMDPESSSLIETSLSPGPDGWTEEKLLMNGLFHIVPSGDFTFFLGLENEWDRRKWLKQFWAGQDPTPTTPENEALEAFERRVRTAFELFQADRKGGDQKFPPWDFRGALFVQFGSPDKREKVKPGWEKWSYYRFRVGFLVSTAPYEQSSHGVRFGNWTRSLYRRSLRSTHNRFLGRPAFWFQPPMFQEARKIQGMRFYLDSAVCAGDSIEAGFWFRFPAENMRARQESGKLVSRFTCKWVVHDEEFNLLFVDSTESERSFGDRFILEKSVITDAIDVRLPEGVFTISLRIEDKQSKRLGIYRRRFWLQRETEPEKLTVGVKQDSLVNLMK